MAKLYLCDWKKAVNCPKTNCAHISGGPCFATSNPDQAIVHMATGELLVCYNDEAGRDDRPAPAAIAESLEDTDCRDSCCGTAPYEPYEDLDLDTPPLPQEGTWNESWDS